MINDGMDKMDSCDWCSKPGHLFFNLVWVNPTGVFCRDCALKYIKNVIVGGNRRSSQIALGHVDDLQLPTKSDHEQKQKT